MTRSGVHKNPWMRWLKEFRCAPSMSVSPPPISTPNTISPRRSSRVRTERKFLEPTFYRQKLYFHSTFSSS